jgi:hypothetical protein
MVFKLIKLRKKSIFLYLNTRYRLVTLNHNFGLSQSLETLKIVLTYSHKTN